MVYKLDAAGQLTVLYSYTEASEGVVDFPSSGVTRDSAGNLYGTNQSGAAVYKLDTAGQLTVLYSFTRGADGSSPSGGVIRDSAGNLNGTNGGDSSHAPYGVVYKLDTAGQLTVLHTFAGGDDGYDPTGGLALDPAGNLYGTTSYGGSVPDGAGFGVVYKVDPAGDFSVLYTFPGGADGSGPNAVIRDSAGDFYGTTTYGGRAGNGTVFKIKP
jgi:uncharacterized repeat protein (TIGR03803 family)